MDTTTLIPLLLLLLPLPPPPAVPAAPPSPLLLLLDRLYHDLVFEHGTRKQGEDEKLSVGWVMWTLFPMYPILQVTSTRVHKHLAALSRICVRFMNAVGWFLFAVGWSVGRSVCAVMHIHTTKGTVVLSVARCTMYLPHCYSC
jgi:hypothetical protein